MNRVSIVLASLLLAGMLSACGGSAPAAITTTTTAPSVMAGVESTASSVTMPEASPTGSSVMPTVAPSIADGLPTVVPDKAAFPVTIENCGRKLTFSKPPERAVSLWQPPNELLLALGVKDRIVALAGNYTALPADLAAAAKDIPTIGSSMAWPSKEVLLSQKPDLVVSEGIEGFAFDASKGYATVQEIEATGAKVISTGSSCTPLQGRNRTMDAVYADLRDLGKIFGVRARADALIARLKQREASITSRVAGKPPVKVAFYNGGEGPLNVLSFGVWADAMKKAGGENVLKPDAYQISVEEFAAAQPDVILVGYFPGQDPDKLIAFLKRTFPTVPAVRNNRFASVPTIETEATVQIMDGLEKIARALHPEAFQ